MRVYIIQVIAVRENFNIFNMIFIQISLILALRDDIGTFI